MTTIPASTALNAYARAAGIGSGNQTPQAGGAKDAAGGFGDMLKQAIDESVETSKAGEAKMAAVTGGTSGNIVDVVTAVAEAETTLQTVVTVRDKVITAYQEIMRMPI
ncbi:flagellar hook-basal body complex protein FliE [Parvibaculum sp.]|jgi:flagellar hook-basal body complex protein FliE|uniref:flagellar hook-basal body complex protein FliE n=1 Tax=Parvibaculum sp. TaxID=2024848 RepID=UPI000C51B81C|nr:flagellar hook-basal body complex protein FliE [Parvibaculum sp.]MAM94087.1 flagellar hook-basal body complex protein FliE [Parvibaculum sp.]HCX66974.1 flagellar hook-basal body complex protein FliE [Rhodobiaceae bacterium]|tara:strand:+ start:1039 stop:1362 length:324 start_codon:yes stop_codon:yes gene_type:complete